MRYFGEYKIRSWNGYIGDEGDKGGKGGRRQRDKRDLAKEIENCEAEQREN